MTEATMIALASAVLAALPPTLVALAGLRQGKKNATALGQNTEITAMVSHKADVLTKTTEIIHGLTDGRLSSVMSDLGVANEQIRRLDATVRDLSEELRRRPRE
jgi:hypothetical protein